MTIIEFMQSFSSPVLTTIFKFFTYIGNEEFYLFAIPILYWIWKKQPMKHLVFLLVPALFVAVALKDVFQVPRPEGVAMIERL